MKEFSGAAAVGVKHDLLGLVITPVPPVDGIRTTPSREGHPDRCAGQLGVRMQTRSGTEQTTAVEVDQGGQVQLRTRPAAHVDGRDPSE